MASTTIENLPGDVLSQILIRLPARPLAQMRCVSKPWNAFLSQPSFIKSHLHRSIHNNKDEIHLVLIDGAMDHPFSVTAFSVSPYLELTNFITLPMAIPSSAYDSVKFLGSVNGLICYCFSSSNDFVIQIWNPSLSAVLSLPPFDLPFCSPDWSKMHFLFHFRFGYDPTTDDYKLVKLLNRKELLVFCSYLGFENASTTFFEVVKELPQVEVYSMRKGSWEIIPHSFPHVTYISVEDILCLDGHDGHLHWLCYIDEEMQLQTIVAFDLSIETFREISLPDSVVASKRGWNGIGVSDGKICVMSCVKDYDCEVWIMNEYGVADSWVKLQDDSWVKLHVLSHSSGAIDPTGFILNNEFLFEAFSDRICLYDPIAAMVKLFSMVLSDQERRKIKYVEYVNSLVWVASTRHGIDR